MPTNNQLLVQIKGDTASIDAALQRSETKLNAFAQATKRVSDDVSKHFNSWGTKAMGWVAEGTIIKNMYSVLKNTVAQFTAFGDTMDKAAQRTGVMASELSQLKFAAEQCGGSFEALDSGLRDLSKNLAAAEEGKSPIRRWQKTSFPLELEYITGWQNQFHVKSPPRKTETRCRFPHPKELNQH